MKDADKGREAKGVSRVAARARRKDFFMEFLLFV
jgi:hypothetical protein